MGVEERVRSLIEAQIAALARHGELPADATSAAFSVDRPKRPEHGDLATNAALALQKAAKKPPRELAGLLADRLRTSPAIRAVEIAGPGFLNLRLAPALYLEVLGEILAAGARYGRAPAAAGWRIRLAFLR